MPVPEDKMQVSTYLEKKLVERVDWMCKELGITRSQFIGASIECGLDDLAFVDYVGLTPRRLRLLGDAIRKVKNVMEKQEKIASGKPVSV